MLLKIIQLGYIYLQCVKGWKILERVFIHMEKDIKTHVAERKEEKEKR